MDVLLQPQPLPAHRLHRHGRHGQGQPDRRRRHLRRAGGRGRKLAVRPSHRRYIGLLVAAFILYTGYSTARDSLSPLLGQSPDPDFVAQIQQTVLAHEEVVGIHDLIVHDYGPGQRMVSLHAEVRSDEDILVIHDAIDRIEMELRGKFHCEATIHMDPIEVDDAATNAMRARVREAVRAIDPALSIHDFRMVVSPTHTNLIFDVCVPHRFRMTDAQVSHSVHESIRNLGEHYFAVIQVEHGYL